MNTRRKVLAAAIAGLAIPAVVLLAQGPAAAQNPDPLKGCMTCHADTANEKIKGPSLKGVFGRSIASEKGYAYSDALKGKAAGQKWTQANLDAFLTDPQVFAPGAKMKAKVADGTQRAAVIEALKANK